MGSISDANPLSQKFMAAILLAESGDDKRAADLLREMGAIMKQQATTDKSMTTEKIKSRTTKKNIDG